MLSKDSAVWETRKKFLASIFGFSLIKVSIVSRIKYSYSEFTYFRRSFCPCVLFMRIKARAFTYVVVYYLSEVTWETDYLSSMPNAFASRGLIKANLWSKSAANERLPETVTFDFWLFVLRQYSKVMLNSLIHSIKDSILIFFSWHTVMLIWSPW